MGYVAVGKFEGAIVRFVRFCAPIRNGPKNEILCSRNSFGQFATQYKPIHDMTCTH